MCTSAFGLGRRGVMAALGGDSRVLLFNRRTDGRERRFGVVHLLRLLGDADADLAHQAVWLPGR